MLVSTPWGSVSSFPHRGNMGQPQCAIQHELFFFFLGKKDMAESGP